jgi:hypothetical protein
MEKIIEDYIDEGYDRLKEIEADLKENPKDIILNEEDAQIIILSLYKAEDFFRKNKKNILADETIRLREKIRKQLIKIYRLEDENAKI